MNEVDLEDRTAFDEELATPVEPKHLTIVPFIAPGLPRTTEEDHAIRSHARRAAEDAKTSKPVRIQFKLVDVEAKTRRQKERRPARGRRHEVAVARASTHAHMGIESPNASPSPHHPFADIASQYVKLAPQRLQYLFRSSAFRAAAEPMFETTHVDANMNMLSVFPGCENDIVFMNALTYAMILMESRCRVTQEALLLQGDTIRLLNARLASGSAKDLVPVAGAVMLLRSIAYKSNDAQAYQVHTDGLSRLLRVTASHLTVEAHRAVFWLNLFSVLLNLDVCDNIRVSLATPEPQWPEGCDLDPSREVPVGFARHRCAIPEHVLDCIRDTIQMQSALRSGALGSKWEDKNRYLDAMQACIEYRLVCVPARQSPIMEGIRLCVFMVCFFSWIETWGSTHIPSQVANRLLDILRKSLRPANVTLWLGHVDVLLWFLLVISSVVECEQGHIPGLKSKRDMVLSETQQSLKVLVPGVIGSDLECALKSFIYCDGWVEDRMQTRAWTKLEESCMKRSCRARSSVCYDGESPDTTWPTDHRVQ